MKFFSGSRILITGGTGSFGKAFISKILKECPDVSRLVVFSRDELKQWELREKYPNEEYPQLRFFLGDLRDKDRMKRALENVDTVVHAAALKQVPAAEYNPSEFIKTNIIGTENLIQACFDNDVKRVVALSTDKAVAPINLYGATKLCSDKLVIAANNVKGSRDIKFSIVRYGNVMGSRGSVIPFFLDKSHSGTLPITNEKMTRFNISLEEGVKMVCWAIDNSFGKEIFVPKIPSFNIIELANAIAPSCEKKIVGIRPGEKLHEEMITSSDSLNTVDLGKYYAILPNDKSFIEEYLKLNNSAVMVPKNFSYSSENNPYFLKKEEIRKLIIQNVDKTFIPK